MIYNHIMMCKLLELGICLTENEACVYKSCSDLIHSLQFNTTAGVYLKAKQPFFGVVFWFSDKFCFILGDKEHQTDAGFLACVSFSAE